MLNAGYVVWTAAFILLPLLIVPMGVSAWKDRDWQYLAAFTFLGVVWVYFAVLWVFFSYDIGVIG